MNRRHLIAALALLALGAGAALWFGIGRRAARESSSLEAPPPHLTAAAPGQVAAKAPDGPKLGGRGGKPAPAAEEEAPEPTRTVVVQVNSTEGKPIDKARVTLSLYIQGEREPLSGESNAAGVARFTGVPGEHVDVRADAEGFAGDELRYRDITTDAEGSVTIALTPGVPIDGQVVSLTDGAPVVDAEIELLPDAALVGFESTSHGGAYDRTRTDATGRFHLRGVPEGQSASVMAEADGFVSSGVGLWVLHGKVTPSPVVVRLDPADRLVGTVRGPDGVGVRGATVFLMRTANEADLAAGLPMNIQVGMYVPNRGAYQGWSDENGAFVVNGLPPDDEYVAVAYADGFAPSVVAGGIRVTQPSRETRRDFSLRACGQVVVRLVDLEGKPFVGAATVRMADPQALRREGHYARQDDDAKDVYRIEKVTPGEGRLLLSGASFLSTEAAVRIDAGKTSEVVLRLDPGATVDGVAVDEDGRPLPEVSVEISGRTAKSDSNGRFVVSSLGRAESDVSAEGPSLDGTARVAIIGPVRVQPPATGVRLVLVRLGEATLRLKTPDGKPYEGEASGSAWPMGDGFGPSGDTSDGGIMRWSGLRPGEWRAQVEAHGFVRIERKFTAHLRESVDLGEAVLERGGVVQITLGDAFGRRTNEVSLIPVPVGPDGKPGAYRDAGWDRIDDGDTFGSATLRLAAGHWQLFAASDDGGSTAPTGPALADFVLVEGGTHSVEIRLPAR